MLKYLHTGSLLLVTALVAGTGAPTWVGGGIAPVSQPKNFPIVIAQPGSYKLSEDLIVPDVDTTVIR